MLTSAKSHAFAETTETPATIDLAKDMPGPTPAFSGLSACKGCLATLQVSPLSLRIRGSDKDSPGSSPRPDILLWPAKRNMATGLAVIGTGSQVDVDKSTTWSAHLLWAQIWKCLASTSQSPLVINLSYQRIPHQIVHPCHFGKETENKWESLYENNIRVHTPTADLHTLGLAWTSPPG